MKNFNRSLSTVLGVAICVLFARPLPLIAQQVRLALLSASPQPGMDSQPSSTPLPDSDVATSRNQALKFAHTIYVNSETVFMPPGTLDRGLMRQKNWDKLKLNIVGNPRSGDLVLQVNRVVFTHLHTFILTDRSTGIVLATGSVRALDGIIASGPMAEQIVKVLSAARLGSPAPASHTGM